ncbi:MAG TPA: exodeoxyribonuclease VII small subunit, partial [Pirellulales bacterium]|nr:exodeoxyribonuclease VII small subunit [Pirellulales bacterium]
MTDPTATDPCPTFEQALEKLERIVHQLEDGQLGLEQSLAHYEQGIGLIKHCFGVLQRVERRIELLSGVDAEGNPVCEPLSDEASFQPATAASSAERKNARAAPKTLRKATARPSGESPNDVDD